jgi:hypothetical protein
MIEPRSEGPTSQAHVPSLYPSYIPYKAQHVILSTAQRILEECCYDFTRNWLPEILTNSGWDCAEAVELTKWTRMLLKYAHTLPPQAVATSGTSLKDIFLSTHQLRHTAVHRLPTTARGIAELVQSALGLAEALQDNKRAVLLEELHRDIDGKIKAMELHKNALEDTLSYELRRIRRRREELDRMEKALIENMVKEDQGNKALVGSLLEDSVCRIFDQEPQPQAILDTDEDESEPKWDEDLNGGKEQEASTTSQARGEGIVTLKRPALHEKRTSDIVSDGLLDDGRHFCGEGDEVKKVPREKAEQVLPSDDMRRKHGKQILKPAPVPSLSPGPMLE